MKKYFIVLNLLFSLLTFAQEEIESKRLSYTQLFQMIELEESSLFKLENAKIFFNPETDEDFIINVDRSTGSLKPKHNNKKTINKRIKLSKVEFTEPKPFQFVGLHNITFKKRVSLPGNVLVINCTFEEKAVFSKSNNLDAKLDSFNDVLMLFDNTFKGSLHVSSDFLSIYSNEINASKSIDSLHLGTIYGKEGAIVDNIFRNLILRIETAALTPEEKFLSEGVFSKSSSKINIEFNSFLSTNTQVIFDTKTEADIDFKNNKFEGSLLIDAKPLTSQNIDIRWSQFPKDFYDIDAYEKSFLTQRYGESIKAEIDYYHNGIKNPKRSVKYLNNFKDSLVTNKEAFLAQMNSLGIFRSYYEEKHDYESANLAYIRLKDMETKRLAYLNQKNPSFKTFFKWRINQFLKVFSSYGTEPERAVIFSLYVILFFAFIYLLFPNSWDKHGRNRIMNRYRFFTKYMNKEAGIHEVYLEDQQKEILASEDFKEYMLKSEKTIPSFFLKTAIPLYKWSIAGIQFSSVILKRLDIMKGSWSELPKSKRIWKSILLIGAFTIAVIYDILIKMLNALMLSINTFTTLGFGEIPIKGLPRYLAIIQGFIGWFMLTIFSVSLISQLLS